MSIEQELMRAARDAEAAGDLATARASYQRLLETNPREARASTALARIELTAGRAEAALGWLAPLSPGGTEAAVLTDAFLLKAAALRLLGRAEEEFAALQSALAVDAYCWPALLQKAELLERQGKPKAAALLYRDVLRISPPAEYRPEAFKKPLAHAEGMVGMYGEALEMNLLQALDGLPGLSQRWREAVSIMAGRSTPYVSVSNQLAVPRLPAQPFFRREMFEWTSELEKRTAAIREEMIAVMSEAGAEFAPYVQYQPGEPVNQWAELNHSRAWTAFHLYRGGEPVPANLARCPRTAEALKLIDSVHLAGTCPNAMFSVLAPKAHIPPHHGESNARLVAHLPLVVPENCLFRVGYDNRRWVEGEVLIFDDTIEHEAWNDSDEIRVVMIFDVWNPLLAAEERVIVQRMAEVERQFRLDA
ncbi:MAG: aspartyl/asparaginyl beta-hydroxylase domain-containing protein [Gammaproteobacteria bacterium]|nr:aspartyl/asparaginyl beta-hydroxylase domain-containing protein [Gammaproteobacteria bacterium]